MSALYLDYFQYIDKALLLMSKGVISISTKISRSPSYGTGYHGDHPKNGLAAE